MSDFVSWMKEEFYSPILKFILRRMLFETCTVHMESSDPLEMLPREITILILRNLDPRSVMSAAMVNNKWLTLCLSDPELRAKIWENTCKQYFEKVFKRIVRIMVFSRKPNPPSSKILLRKIISIQEPEIGDVRWIKDILQLKIRILQNRKVPKLDLGKNPT
ncbi:hypothetical protein C0J52_10465 [Blattella germanica]|nr:hypothetical protein C0J52_10465 [Blattella germanica]